ncbi:hypothetical protein RDI58_027014 [Solanum bulbocastanum]|uniref:Uncharacterized protein n=1 Tax=Solanum bulbocastanum TaxID=147425 RepID=A0AAN8SUM4_SOLBU
MDEGLKVRLYFLINNYAALHENLWSSTFFPGSNIVANVNLLLQFIEFVGRIFYFSSTQRQSRFKFSQCH